MVRYRYPLLSTALLLSAAIFTGGCVRPFSEEALNKVNKNISFSELKIEPERYKGAWVLLAGLIIDSINTKDGTSIEVLQKPMGCDGRPEDTDATEGQFIALTGRF